MKIRTVNQSKHPLPEYETIHSTGIDLRAELLSPVLLKPMEMAGISTVLFVENPEGFGHTGTK